MAKKKKPAPVEEEPDLDALLASLDDDKEAEAPAEEEPDLDALLASLDDGDDDKEAEAPAEEEPDLDALLASLGGDEESEAPAEEEEEPDLDALLASLGGEGETEDEEEEEAEEEDPEPEDEDDDLAARLAGDDEDAPAAPDASERLEAEVKNAKTAAERLAPLRERYAQLRDELRVKPGPDLVRAASVVADQLRVLVDAERLAAARVRTLLAEAKGKGSAEAKAIAAGAPGPRPALEGTRAAVAVLPKVTTDLKAMVTKVRGFGSKCTTEDLAALSSGLPEALDELTGRLDRLRVWRAIRGPEADVDTLLKDARLALRPVLEGVKAYVQALAELMRQCLYWTEPRNKLDPKRRPMLDANIEIVAGWFDRALVTLEGVTAAASSLT